MWGSRGPLRGQGLPAILYGWLPAKVFMQSPRVLCCCLGEGQQLPPGQGFPAILYGWFLAKVFPQSPRVLCC